MKNYIKDERNRLKISQQELADRVSISLQTLNSIEAGRYIPSTLVAIRISNVFKVTVNEIFQPEEDD